MEYFRSADLPGMPPGTPEMPAPLRLHEDRSRAGLPEAVYHRTQKGQPSQKAAL
jgi:hypothetical protein